MPNLSLIECFPMMTQNATTPINRNVIFGICFIAVISHSLFWLQLIFFPSLRQRSMQWIYAYLIVDEPLLIQFILVFIARSQFKPCWTSSTWIYIVCFIDAIIDNYFNILQSYIILALNLCRYVTITYNHNVYNKNVRLLVFSHILIYSFPFIVLLGQYLLKWAILVDIETDLCDVHFQNIAVKILNICVAYVSPILLNILVILASIYQMRHSTRLTKHQHYKTAEQKYYRSLIIQFSIFYTIWISLWSPNIVVYQLSNIERQTTFNVQLLNYVNIVLDPLIIGSLDIRFWRIWKRFFSEIKVSPEIIRVRPTAINLSTKIRKAF